MADDDLRIYRAGRTILAAKVQMLAYDLGLAVQNLHIYDEKIAELEAKLSGSPDPSRQ